MRVNINLASRKYEDVRRFFLVWGASLGLLVLLSVGLTVAAYFKWTGANKAAVEARQIQPEISTLEKQLNELRAVENLPENRKVIQQRQYWNSQILRRTLSWTLLLGELQRIMPNRAYLNSVQPELTADNRVKLRMVITGERKSDDLELIERMEGSRRFQSTRPLSEALQKPRKGEGVTYKFEIETIYLPPTSPEPALSPQKAANKEGA